MSGVDGRAEESEGKTNLLPSSARVFDLPVHAWTWSVGRGFQKCR